MAYIEESLSDGEIIQHRFNFHWMAMLSPGILAVVGLMLMSGADQTPQVGVAVLAISAWWVLSLKFHEFGVTNKRVIRKKGIISCKTEEMKLRSIETIEIDQDITGRIFGYGTVKVTGRGISSLEFVKIDDPMSVKRRIESISNPVD